MPFTNKFLKVPIRLVSTKLADMDVSERGEDSFMMINPFDITLYYPVSEDETNDERTAVKLVFKSGDTTVVYESIEQFEKRLNVFMK
jgi:hypothetical protein